LQAEAVVEVTITKDLTMVMQAAVVDGMVREVTQVLEDLKHLEEVRDILHQQAQPYLEGTLQRKKLGLAEEAVAGSAVVEEATVQLITITEALAALGIWLIVRQSEFSQIMRLLHIF
jgi:DNA-directed RNA polymerase